MSLKREELVGCWRKRASTGGDRLPDQVEFFADGTYRASSAGRRSDWDEAAFDVLEGGRLRVGTATDRKVTYQAGISEYELTIEHGGTRVTYERSREP